MKCHRRAHARVRRWLAAGLGLSLGLALASCEDDVKRDCIPGETAACVGPAECAGTHVCEITGKFNACRCDDVAVDGPAPAGGPGAQPGCRRGETRECVGAGDCPGTATCDSDGTFGACRCGPSSTLPSGSRPNIIGAACRGTSECGMSLECWRENAEGVAAGLGGGPVGGYCTAVCSQKSDCALLDPNADCLTFVDGMPGLCFAGCTTGTPAAGETKCLGRSNVACWSQAAIAESPEDPAERQPGLCLPKCESDADCPGRLCNLGFRVATCDDLVLPGSPTGSSCSFATDCLGHLCRPISGDTLACTATCTVGAENACGRAGAGGVREAACVRPLVWEGGSSFGPGDVGLCAELCDSPTDCGQAGSTCEPSADAAGRAGFCVPPAGAPDAGG